MRSSLPRWTAALLCFGGLAAGCIPSLQGNEPREVRKDVPKSFRTGEVAPSSAGTMAERSWHELFASPALRALVDTALRNNRELHIQFQELVIAQSEVSARRGEYQPKVKAGVGAGLDKSSRHTSQGVSDDAHGLPDPLGNFALGASASWELDIWQKLSHATKAAQLRYLASIEARHFLMTQLVAEIARSYYELIGLDNELEVLERNIEVQTKALEVVRIEKLAGRTTELAVQRFEAEVLKNKSRRYELEQERVQTENRINFLLGRYPEGVHRDAEEFKSPLPSELRAGLPSALLTNRPDVRQAELELEAVQFDVKAARAAFYPSLSIDANVGYRAFNAAHLVATPDSVFYGLAGNLTAPLLNRKAIEAQYRGANARQIQAVYRYEQTLLQAFTEVANQLAAIDNLQKSYDLGAQQVAALGRSVDISTTLFQSARADYMEVLLTRRDSLEAEVSLLETKRRQWQAVVTMYQALGGGWRSEP